MTITKKSVTLTGDTCVPGECDVKLAALQDQLTAILSPMSQSMWYRRLYPSESQEVVEQCLRLARVFVVEALPALENSRKVFQQVYDSILEGFTVNDIKDTPGDDLVDDLTDLATQSDTFDCTEQDPHECGEEASILDTVDDGDVLVAAVDASAPVTHARKPKANISIVLTKAMERLHEAGHLVHVAQLFLDVSLPLEVGRVLDSHALKLTLATTRAAVVAAADVGRIAANQLLEVRARDLVTGFSMCAARFLVKNPSEALLGSLLAQAAQHVQTEFEPKSPASYATQTAATVQYSLLVVGSDGEANTVL